MTMLKAPIAAALLLVTLLGQACTSDNIGETNGQRCREPPSDRNVGPNRQTGEHIGRADKPSGHSKARSRRNNTQHRYTERKD